MNAQQVDELIMPDGQRDLRRVIAAVLNGGAEMTCEHMSKGGSLDTLPWEHLRRLCLDPCCQLMRMHARGAYLRCIQYSEVIDAAASDAFFEAQQSVVWEACSRRLPELFSQIRTDQRDVNAISPKEWQTISRAIQQDGIPESVLNHAYALIMGAILDSYEASVAIITVRLNRSMLAAIRRNPEPNELNGTIGVTEAFVMAQLAKASSVNARMDDLLITSSRTWGQLRPQIEEHFEREYTKFLWQDDGEGFGEEAARSDYIICAKTFQPPGQADIFCRIMLRRLVALIQCFRDSSSYERGLSVEVAGHEFQFDIDAPAACVIFGTLPQPNSKVTFDAHPMGDADHPADRYFFLPTAPVLGHDDIALMIDRGLERAWRWLNDPTCDKSAHVRLAVERFGTATGMLSNAPNIGENEAASWGLVGLITCLETLFRGDRRETCDRLYLHLKRHDPRNVDRVLAMVQAAYDQRNETVHSGAVSITRENVLSLRNVVAHALHLRINEEISDVAEG